MYTAMYTKVVILNPVNEAWPEGSGDQQIFRKNLTINLMELPNRSIPFSLANRYQTNLALVLGSSNHSIPLHFSL